MTVVSEDVEDFLAHYGVKGMKWGVRKDRISTPSIRKPGYRVDSEGRIQIDKGHRLQRVYKSDKNGKATSDGTTGTNYFSFTENDNHIYVSMMGAGAQSKLSILRKLASDTISSSVATETLKSPSRKEGFEALQKAIQAVGPSNGVRSFKGDFSHRNALRWYQDANAKLGLAKDSKLQNEFFGNLKKNGFNILLDETDSGFLSELPIIVLDGAKSTRQISVSDITEKNLSDANDFAKKHMKTYGRTRSLEDLMKTI